MKNEGNSYYGARSQLQHTEIWEKIDHELLRYTKAGKKVHDVIYENSFVRIVKTLSPFWTKGEYALAARARITGLGSNWVGLLHYGI